MKIVTLNLFLDGYEAKITSRKWAELNKCSKDTAIRDIQDLLQKNILKEDAPGAKRPGYSINYGAGDSFIQRFTDVLVHVDNGAYYLTASFDGNQSVKELLLPLDAERYLHGDSHWSG